MSTPATRSARAWILLALLVALATGTLTGWQLGRRDAVDRRPTYLEQLAVQLELRPDQIAAIESVLAAEDRDVDALLERQLEALRGPVAERRRHTEAELVACLDPDQRARYEALLAGAAPSAGGSGR
jgi:hypothetical protein